MSPSTDTDVAIVGGGMVGAALACALAQQGVRVCLLEARPPDFDWPDNSHDLRVSALTLASCQLFSDLGVWPLMQSMRVSPFDQMHVWDANSSGVLHLDAADSGQREMGYVVENRVTVAALWQQLQKMVEVELRCPAQLNNYHTEPDAVVLHLNEGNPLRAQVLIGADGSLSPVRELANIQTIGWGYDQKALVATVRPQKSHQRTAWQRFMREGPLALLPLTDDLLSIVWTAQTESTEQRLKLSNEDFCAELEIASEGALGEFELLGPRAAFPLKLQYSTAYGAERVILVGDAIHTIHPLAGQGANLGLADAAELARILGEAHQKGRSLASQQILKRYQRARKADNLLMMGAMDGFKRIYSDTSWTISATRALGMEWINGTPWLKRRIADYAMGQVGPLLPLEQTDAPQISQTQPRS